MSSVPAEIAGIGSSAIKLRVSPGFDPLKAKVGPDEYFLLSRIDGSCSLREVLLSTGLPVERGIAIVLKLRSIGALLLPGEKAPPPSAAAPSSPVVPNPPVVAAPRAPAPPSQAEIGRAPTIQVTAAQTPPAIARTATPAAPTMGRTSTPAQGMPAISRTATPAVPLPPSRMPAKAAPVVEPDPPTQPPRRQSDDDAGTHLGRPNVARPPAKPALRPAPPPPSASLDVPTVRRAASADINIVLPNPTDQERAALAEPGDLDAADRLKILALARLLDARDPWALLGVPAGADAKILKRAYFKLSKDIHPDRYYGRQLGTFADRLNAVFEAVSRAYARLTQPERSKQSGGHVAVTAEQPQTPQEYAGELFERACNLEVGGDALGAMKLFAAAVRIDGQTRYLRRATSCALAAGQPKTALEYAKKAQSQAPNDASSARLLAQAFRAAGKLADAEEVLVMAMAMKSENDVLTAELRNDLNEVRRQIQAENR